MVATQKTYLNLISLNLLESWSVQSLLDKKVAYNKKYELARIGDFLIKSRDIVNIEDGEEYRRVTVKIRNGGVTLRDIEKGENIGTKKQYRAKAGQFIVSKIDARNGAFGIIPSELDGAMVTNDFPLFTVNEKAILSQFLVLITTTKEFIKFAQSCSSGTTNRQRMDIDLFLQQKIPLPSLQEQKRIVTAYQTKIQEAETLEKEANDLEGEIEKYFLSQLELQPFSIKERKSGLITTSFNKLDRWDVFSSDARISVELKNSKYELKSIGQAFSFAKRSWNNQRHHEETFRYIEIGAIDPVKGIVQAKELKIVKAPSRATQTIKTGDLIIGTTRPYLKKFALVTSEYNDCVCSSGFSILETSNEYHLPYLLQFLRCSYGIEQLKNRMTGGLYPAITEAELKEVKIPFPNVSEQKTIMNLIETKKSNILKNKDRINIIKSEVEKDFEQEIFGVS